MLAGYGHDRHGRRHRRPRRARVCEAKFGLHHLVAALGALEADDRLLSDDVAPMRQAALLRDLGFPSESRARNGNTASVTLIATSLSLGPSPDGDPEAHRRSTDWASTGPPRRQPRRRPSPGSESGWPGRPRWRSGRGRSGPRQSRRPGPSGTSANRRRCPRRDSYPPASRSSGRQGTPVRQPALYGGVGRVGPATACPPRLGPAPRRSIRRTPLGGARRRPTGAQRLLGYAFAGTRSPIICSKFFA